MKILIKEQKLKNTESLWNIEIDKFEPLQLKEYHGEIVQNGENMTTGYFYAILKENNKDFWCFVKEKLTNIFGINYNNLYQYINLCKKCKLSYQIAFFDKNSLKSKYEKFKIAEEFVILTQGEIRLYHIYMVDNKSKFGEHRLDLTYIKEITKLLAYLYVEYLLREYPNNENLKFLLDNVENSIEYQIESDFKYNVRKIKTEEYENLLENYLNEQKRTKNFLFEEMRPFLKKTGTNKFLVLFTLAEDDYYERQIIQIFTLKKLNQEEFRKKLKEIEQKVIKQIKNKETYIHINVYQIINTDNEIVKELLPVLQTIEDSIYNIDNNSITKEIKKYLKIPVYNIAYYHFNVIPPKIKEKRINEIIMEIKQEFTDEEVKEIIEKLI